MNAQLFAVLYFVAWLVEIARAAAPQDSRLDQSARPVEDCEATAAGG